MRTPGIGRSARRRIRTRMSCAAACRLRAVVVAAGTSSPRWRSMKPVSTSPRTKSGWRQRANQKGVVGLQAGDLDLLERSGKLRRRAFARRVVRDHLGDHRIVERRDRVAFAHAGVDAHVMRQAQPLQPSDRRQEALLRIFGVKPHFDGVAVDVQFALRLRQRLAGRDAQLPFDQIGAGDRLRHRMFDLQARVHLHEPDAIRLQAVRRVGDEFDRAGADIVRRPWRPSRPPRRCSCASRRSCRAPALPRSPSGGGAAASSRARTDGRRCRACRRRPAPRCDAAGRHISRSAPCRRRRRTSPRAWRLRARRRTPTPSSTLRMPLPPPPATALIRTG